MFCIRRRLCKTVCHLIFFILSSCVRGFGTLRLLEAQSSTVGRSLVRLALVRCVFPSGGLVTLLGLLLGERIWCPGLEPVRHVIDPRALLKLGNALVGSARTALNIASERILALQRSTRRQHAETLGASVGKTAVLNAILNAILLADAAVSEPAAATFPGAKPHVGLKRGFTIVAPIVLLIAGALTVGLGIRVRHHHRVRVRSVHNDTTTAVVHHDHRSVPVVPTPTTIDDHNRAVMTMAPAAAGASASDDDVAFRLTGSRLHLGSIAIKHRVRIHGNRLHSLRGLDRDFCGPRSGES
mmetsp:Transcript_56326/g.123387  ORF Transcript_56326/g.123387 Transcript_56326/m.123387 type:complete len:298 (-) Transcript_56326:79-972(-)